MAYDFIKRKQVARDWSCGSLLIPAKQETRLLNKIDDVRYDVRNTKAVVGGAAYALAGALAFLGFAKVYKAAVARKAHA